VPAAVLRGSRALDQFDSLGHRPLVAEADGEAHALVGLQRGQPGALQGPRRDEHVPAAVVRGDETEALAGVEEFDRSGCAVVISNGDEGEKRMCVGEHHAGKVWVDLTGTREEHIIIEEDGFATFPVNGKSVSVWARPDEDVE
jgi:hypothetical protein